MLAIVDYGMGNLFSVASSLEFLGIKAVISSDKKVIEDSSHILLPGVGAFRDAAKILKESKMDEFLKNQANLGKPILGICLGMQILFEKSFEYGEHEGLGLLKGDIIPMKGNINPNLKIPQIGWNDLRFHKTHPVLKNLKNQDYVYFVHSYFASNCDESLIASTNYGGQIPAIVGKDNILACQFHPEKSSEVGLEILKSFVKWDGKFKENK